MLKSEYNLDYESFSALQRAEIAEIPSANCATLAQKMFQCSSTSRNC